MLDLTSVEKTELDRYLDWAKRMNDPIVVRACSYGLFQSVVLNLATDAHQLEPNQPNQINYVYQLTYFQAIYCLDDSMPVPSTRILYTGVLTLQLGRVV